LNIVLAIIAPRPDFPQVRIIPGTFISGFFISCIVLMSLQGNSQARETASMNSYYGGMLFSNNQSVVDSTQSEELMLEGVKEKIIGNLSLAQDFFMQSLRADARNDASLYELSLIELGKKNYEKARQYIVLALKVKPLESYYLSVLVDIYTGSQNTEGLIKTYSILIKQSPLNGNLYLNMADVLVSQNKIEQAIILFS
jgi:tetratricopeptide (TPR) repeat protein